MPKSYDQHLQDQEIANEGVEPREGKCGGCEKEAILNENNCCLRCESDLSAAIHDIDFTLSAHGVALSIQDGEIVLMMAKSNHKATFGAIWNKNTLESDDFNVKEID